MLINYHNCTKQNYDLQSSGKEMDLGNNILLPIEIKSAQTFNESYLHAMRQWNRYSKKKGGMLLYDGKLEIETKDKIKIRNWRRANDII